METLGGRVGGKTKPIKANFCFTAENAKLAEERVFVELMKQ